MRCSHCQKNTVEKQYHRLDKYWLIEGNEHCRFHNNYLLHSSGFRGPNLVHMSLYNETHSYPQIKYYAGKVAGTASKKIAELNLIFYVGLFIFKKLVASNVRKNTYNYNGS